MTTVFGRIIAGTLPSKKLYEDEEFIVIEDIHPLARVHLLIIPKEPFSGLQSLPENKLHLVGKAVRLAQTMAEQLDIEESYRFLTNNGAEAGQTIFHLHFHLIGGEPLGSMA